MRRIACLLLALGLLAQAPAHAAALDESEVRLLALNIYHEAKGQGREGMLAVGWVVLNRMRDRAFPATVEGVVTQGRAIGRCQFGWLCDQHPDQPRELGQYRLAERLARELLGASPPEDPTAGALWFRALREGSPDWSVRVVQTVRLGGHNFYARERAGRQRLLVATN